MNETFDAIPVWHAMLTEYGSPLPYELCEDCSARVDGGALHCPDHQLVPIGEVTDS